MTAKTLGSLLLAAGFLAGAYVIVAEVEAVNWMLYSICLALMLAGMVLHRISKGRGAAETEKHEEKLDVLQSSLNRLVEKIRTYATVNDERELLGLHQRIDSELMTDFNTFVEARESMIPRLGMEAYADILSPFATGERLINRVWSASVDGYVDEVKKCIELALIQLEQSSDRLRAARN